jgi:hypothetical protein
MGQGNHSSLYLMRALSLWAWRFDNQEAVNLLMQYADILQARLTKGDAGPPGFTIAYLHLYNKAHPEINLDLPSLEKVQSALETGHYWLELVALSAIFGTERERWLRQFQNQREDNLSSLENLPSWLGGKEKLTWRDSIDSQTRQEKEVLLGKPSIKQLVDTGLLPI